MSISFVLNGAGVSHADEDILAKEQINEENIGIEASGEKEKSAESKK